jgi:hypothetical protein
MERDNGAVVRDENGRLAATLWDSDAVRGLVGRTTPRVGAEAVATDATAQGRAMKSPAEKPPRVWDTLTVAEAMNVFDAVENIRATANAKNRLTVDGEADDAREMIDAVAKSSAYLGAGERNAKTLPLTTRSPTRRGVSGPGRANASSRPSSSACRQ